MNEPPIFIHSLFRAGSTYLFEVFRRSRAGYWCYQEPLHEMAVFARDDPELLLKGFGPTEMDLNRHPQLDAPYFQELYDTWPAWKDVISASAVYDGYFAPANADTGISFWRTLIDSAKGRPVFQECRTSSRIGVIKNVLDGFHIYLWRNPWDQWWSYKVTDYFDAANQLIINAPSHPDVIARLRREIGFCGCESNDLRQQFDWFLARRLQPEHSYLVFYVLWCLGLREGIRHADLLLNIDRLSDSRECRSEVLRMLKRNGIGKINFSDCSIPHALYGKEDRAFFADIEERAHALFLLSGLTRAELDEMLTMRRSFEPLLWEHEGTAIDPAGLVRDAERARALVRSAESREVHLRSTLVAEIEERTRRAEAAETRAAKQEERAVAAETRAAKQEERAVAAETRAAEQEERATVAETRAAEQESRIEELAAQAHHLWQQACVLEAERDALRQSWSWRITGPLRWVWGIHLRAGSGIRRAANHAVSRTINTCQRPLAKLMSAVLQNPTLSHRINQRFLRYPALHQQLLGIAQRRGVIPGTPTQIEPLSPPAMPETEALDHLTPHARRIYNDLKAAIESRRKENG